MPKQEKRTGRTLTSKMLALFTFLVFLESGFLLLLSGLLDDSERRLEQERFARTAVSAIAKFSAMHQQTVAALINQTRLKHGLNEEYKEIFSRLPEKLKELEILFKDHPDDLASIKELGTSVDEALELIEKVIASSRDKETDQKKMIYHHYSIQLIDMSEKVSKQTDEIAARYKKIEESASASTANMSDSLLFICLIAGFLVNAGIAIALYLFVVRGITQRLTVVSTNTINMSQGKPLLEPVQGQDEVARLDETFRAMASNLAMFKTKEKTILENAANFICLLEGNGKFITVPPACVAIWGFTLDQLQGTKLQSIVKAEFTESTTAALQSLTEVGSSTTFENQIRCPDGTVQDLAWTVTLNEGKKLICVAHDITEKKRIANLIVESEQWFTTIIESMPIAVLGCNPKMAIETTNKATTSTFLYQSQELLDKPIDVLLKKPAESKLDKATSEALELSKKERTQLSAWRKDGSQVPVELRLNAYTDQHGERLLVCFRDISARVELELAKRDFVSMIGHDLRSPLMALYGTLGMLATDSEKTVFKDAEPIVQKLVSLINDFLDLGKVESAPETLVLTDIRLSQFILNVVGECEKIDFGYAASTSENSEAMERKFNIVIPDGCDPIIRIDEVRLSKAFICLIGTLCYFNSRGTEVSIEVLPAQTQTVIVRIAAANGWLPQSVKDTCIEGYAFVETSKVATFSGLRLALSRAIIKAHPGTLYIVQSGSSEHFEITLPLAAGDRS